MSKSDQGVDSNRYCIIPRSLIFIFDSLDRVLLLKGSKEKRLWPGLLNGIGGHIEPGEDIYQAANRELFEEAGISQIQLRFCGQIMVDISADIGVGIFIFRGDYDGQELIASSEGSLNWTRMVDIDNAPLVEDLFELLPKIHQHHPGDPLIIGRYRYQPSGALTVFFN